MKNIICIYHGNCADGFGAAWCVRKALGEDSVEFYPGIYQTDPPDVTGKKVILVDFSYKKPVIDKMAESAKSILILDHHKSAAEDLSEYPAPPKDIPGHKGWIPNSGVYAEFDMERSGAAMAWDHFCGGIRPTLINHIQDRDLWKFKLEGTREIQASLFSYPYDFKGWDELMSTRISVLYEQGKAIERKHFKDINELIQGFQSRMDIAGHNVPVLNAPYFFSSDAGHIMAENELFAACYWIGDDGVFFSLRSQEDGGIDVSEIAKKYGGGGHKHAAGFKISSLGDL